MAFINAEGKSISYECSGLIEELKQDIVEFGGDKIVAVWCREYEGVIIYTNYDFIEEEQPIQQEEIRTDETIRQMTMSALLEVLERQNTII